MSSLGEFIDNSIEATRYNDEGVPRKISVILDLVSGNEYLDIIDNGEGFERCKLKAGSTLGVRGRDKGVTEKEDLDKENIDRVFDSRLHRFGVGLKYANYFLGSKFQITTKRLEQSAEYQITHSKTDTKWTTATRQILSNKKGSGTNIRIEGLEIKVFEQLKRRQGDQWLQLLCRNLRTIYYPYILMNKAPGFVSMMSHIREVCGQTLRLLQKGPKSKIGKDRKRLLEGYETAHGLLSSALGEFKLALRFSVLHYL